MSIIKNQLEILYQEASIGILLVNQKGDIMDGNKYLKNLFGYKDDELNNLNIDSLVEGKINEKLCFLAETKEDSRNEPFEITGIKKDRTRFPIGVTFSRHNINNQKQILLFIHDVSLKMKEKHNIETLYSELEKKIENRTLELEKTLEIVSIIHEKLEFTLARQKVILGNAPIMIVLLDEEGIIQFFNPAATKLTGYTEEEIIYKYSPVIFHDKEDLEKCKEELNEKYNLSITDDWIAIKTKADKNEIRELECRFIKKNKKPVDILLTMTPIFDNKKKVSGYVAAALNIGERKKWESNLMNALDKEKKLGELKSNFISIASHEFRTPLSTILSSAYLTEKYKLTSEQSNREKHLHRIVNATSNLSNILNDFLSVGKIDEGKISLNFSNFNLKETIEGITNDMTSLLKEGQHFEYNHMGTQLVFLDDTLVKNILINLLSNAIKFSPEFSPISIISKSNDSFIKIAVTDKGIGISTKDQEHLMDRFYRASNAINISGTGLGLHIVSKYAERLNGKLAFESQINKGSTFTVLINKKTKKHENNSTY
jgi:PAS domain S-box-containing protein